MTNAHIKIKSSRFRMLLKENGFVCRRPKHDLTNLQDADARQAAEKMVARAKKSAEAGEIDLFILYG